MDLAIGLGARRFWKRFDILIDCVLLYMLSLFELKIWVYIVVRTVPIDLVCGNKIINLIRCSSFVTIECLKSLE